MDLKNLTVVLLAGDPKCLKLIPPNHKESYLTRAIKVLMPLGCKIVLVHHPKVQTNMNLPFVRRVAAGATVSESAAAGLAVCDTEFVMLLATDFPLITSAAVREFFERASTMHADAVIALAELAACERLGHRTKHPIPLGGKKYKFGSAFVLRRESADHTLRQIKDFLVLRKQPIRFVLTFLSRRFAGSAIRFALSHRWLRFSLSFDEAEKLIQERIGVRARGIVTNPVLAIDHD